MNLFLFWYKQNKMIVFVIVFFILISFMYSYFSTFKKVITVKEKYSIMSGKYGQNVITDSDGNVYSISNSMYHNFFTATELFTKIAVGQTYRVNGFGYRIPFLSIYPNIIKASKV